MKQVSNQKERFSRINFWWLINNMTYKDK